jgi:hypothetical protein
VASEIVGANFSLVLTLGGGSTQSSASKANASFTTSDMIEHQGIPEKKHRRKRKNILVDGGELKRDKWIRFLPDEDGGLRRTITIEMKGLSHTLTIGCSPDDDTRELYFRFYVSRCGQRKRLLLVLCQRDGEVRQQTEGDGLNVIALYTNGPTSDNQGGGKSDASIESE